MIYLQHIFKIVFPTLAVDGEKESIQSKSVSAVLRNGAHKAAKMRKTQGLTGGILY